VIDLEAERFNFPYDRPATNDGMAVLGFDYSKSNNPENEHILNSLNLQCRFMLDWLMKRTHSQESESKWPNVRLRQDWR
jgi:hypothetical protein